MPSLSRLTQSAHMLGLTRIGLYFGGDMSLVQLCDLHPRKSVRVDFVNICARLTNWVFVSCAEEAFF
jgi:hypothetical protein